MLILLVLAKDTPKASVGSEPMDKGNVAAPPVRMKEGLLFGLIAIISFSVGDVLARGVLADSGLGLVGGLVIYLAAAAVLVGISRDRFGGGARGKRIRFPRLADVPVLAEFAGQVATCSAEGQHR